MLKFLLIVLNGAQPKLSMNSNPQLCLYSSLARVKLLKKSYTAKIMTVAFLGTHVPLLTLLFSFVISNAYSLDAVARILGIALLATLTGTGITLYALRQLLSPVIVTSAALQAYLNSKILPDLPTEFADEAGTLMADTSQTLHKLDELIHYITNYDELTGLPNRDLFCDRLCQFLSQPEHNQHLVAVLLVGIDEFTTISHTLEPKTVNLLIRSVAQRLVSCTTPADILAYWGGNEFAIAQTDLPTFESVVERTQLLLNTLAKPFFVEGDLIHLTVSVGITVNSLDDSAGVEQLVQQGHISLHQAMKQGRKQYQFYSPEMNAQLREQLLLANELNGALERGEMQVYYQPLIDLHSNQITAVEALIRWQHPTWGLVSPAKFIPIAEANGLIVPIGEWVLRTACTQNRAWQRAGLPPVRMSVNLSARQFEQPNLVEVVSQILEETELDAAHLELEVTESFLMADLQRSIDTLNQLRQLNLSIALDDFGTGYSSLSYLKRLPINMLKIDRSFVQDVISNPESAAVTNSIIALSKTLGLHITAEGIETAEQLHYLQTQRCQEGQGFYFSRPVPADQMTDMLYHGNGMITPALAVSVA